MYILQGGVWGHVNGIPIAIWTPRQHVPTVVGKVKTVKK